MSTLLYFAFWAALFFVMMRFGCGAHVMGHGHGGHSGGHSDPPGGRTPPTRDIDPVCGMNVETNSAKSSLYRGRVYYFILGLIESFAFAWYVALIFCPLFNFLAARTKRRSQA